MISIDDVRAAAQRIGGHVRRTPVIAADHLKTGIGGGPDLILKLEMLQPTGSFKVRGATNKLLKIDPAILAKGIVTASGGNHGLATARSGFIFSVPTTIYLPGTVAPDKLAKIGEWGAETRVVGGAWQEANDAALEQVERTGAAYFHPFADPDVVAGQGTVGLEVLEQVPDVETILVAMGGGGLISGVGIAVKAINPNVRIVGIEAAGSPVLLRSLEAGKNTTLAQVTTSVATMACARTTDPIFDIVRHKVDEIVLVDDEEMREAACWLWFEMGLATDLSGAAAVAALRKGRIAVRPRERICAIVCGAGPDAILR